MNISNIQKVLNSHILLNKMFFSDLRRYVIFFSFDFHLILYYLPLLIRIILDINKHENQF